MEANDPYKQKIEQFCGDVKSSLPNIFATEFLSQLEFMTTYSPSCMGYVCQILFKNRSLYAVKLEGHNFENMTDIEIAKFAAQHLSEGFLSILWRHSCVYNSSRIVKPPKDEEEETNG